MAGRRMMAAGERSNSSPRIGERNIAGCFKVPVTGTKQRGLTWEGYETAVKPPPLNPPGGASSGRTAQPKRPCLDMTPMDRGARDTADVLSSFSIHRCDFGQELFRRATLLKAQGLSVKSTEQRITHSSCRSTALSVLLNTCRGDSICKLVQRIQAAHLAGTIGTPTIAIQGATTERIYRHIPEVISYRKKALSCAGCHCLPPNFRHTCDYGCLELFRTFPEEVAEFAVEVLGRMEKAA